MACKPGEMHEIDKAFYDLTIKERDYERLRVDRLREENKRLFERLVDAETLVLRFAVGKRRDGTYNYSREAVEQQCKTYAGKWLDASVTHGG